MKLTTLTEQPFLDGSSGLPLDRPFTHREARTLGLRTAELTWLVRRGFLRRPVKGVYVASQVADSTRLRAECLRLVIPDDCVVGGRHAGWLLGADMVLAPNEHLRLQPITIYRPSGRGRLRNPLADSAERALRDRDVTQVHGLAVTTPLRTACDLGRVRHREQSLSGIDAIRYVYPIPTDEVVDAVEDFRGHRWVTTLRAMAPISDHRAASPGESALRLRWLDAGLPAPTPQVPVWSDGVLLGVLDLANEDLRFAAEYDGSLWHDSPEQRAHDERRRRVIEAADWVVGVFRAANVYGHHQDAHLLLRAGVQRARSLYGRRTSA